MNVDFNQCMTSIEQIDLNSTEFKTAYERIRAQHTDKELHDMRLVDIAKTLRETAKTLGIKGLSIRRPQRSMCIHIHMIRPDAHEHTPDYIKLWNAAVPKYQDCPICQRLRAADRKLSKIIDTIFPEWTDKSDAMQDISNFTYLIH